MAASQLPHSIRLAIARHAIGTGGAFSPAIPEPTMNEENDGGELLNDYDNKDDSRLCELYEVQSRTKGTPTEVQSINEVLACANSSRPIHQGRGSLNQEQRTTMVELSLVNRAWYTTAMALLWNSVHFEDLLDQCSSGFDQNDTALANWMMTPHLPPGYSDQVCVTTL